MTREPAPEPTPDEQATIKRFGIFQREERLERLTNAVNAEIGRIISRTTKGRHS